MNDYKTPAVAKFKSIQGLVEKAASLASRNPDLKMGADGGLGLRSRAGSGRLSRWVSGAAWVLLPLIMLLLFSVQSQAQYVTGTINYTVDNGDGTTSTLPGIEIFSYTGQGGTVSIPSTIDGLPVVAIGPDAFMYCPRPISVTIPNTIGEIGPRAFEYCTGLVSVTMSTTGTSIAASAFANCTGLTNVTIPSAVKIIGDNAFSTCTGLTSVSLSGTKMGSAAFQYCTGLTSVTIPGTFGLVGDNAFSTCTGLTTVTLNNGIGAIGNGAFQFCEGLTKVTYPGSISSSSVSFPDSTSGIGALAFASCNRLTSATISPFMEFIGAGAFSDCKLLTTIDIQYHVSNIWDGAFSNCPALTTVTIPASVTNIAASAFANCPVLNNVTIPSSVTDIRSLAFSGCIGLTSITIPDSVTNIESSAFTGCTGLLTATIGNGVTNIQSSAFSGCSALNTVTVGTGVTKVGSSAFAGCDGLTSFLFLGDAPSPDDNSVFDNNNMIVYYLAGASRWTSTFAGHATAQWPGPIKQVTPNHGAVAGGTSVVIIGTNFTSATAVKFGGTPATSFTINSATQITAVAPAGTPGQQVDVSVVTPRGTTVNTPADKFAYDAPVPSVSGVTPGHGGSAGGTTVVITGSNFTGASAVQFGTVAATSFTVNSDSQITAIAPASSGGLRVDVSVTNSYGTSVSSSADFFTFDLVGYKYANVNGSISILSFSGTGAVTIPSSINGVPVTSIGPDAFMYCTGPISLTIPSSITSIGDHAFRYCTALVSITLPSTLTSVGNGAFQYCTGLTSITLPDGVTSIGTDAFSLCTGLTNVTMGNALETIGDTAFQYCTGLSSITFGNTLATIGNGTFQYCTALPTVTLPNSVTSLGADAFSSCTGLSRITLNYGLETIGDRAFEYCDGLPSLVIPDSVTSIGANAFSFCNSLTSMTVPFAVTNIGAQAFASCDNLANITISNGITNLWDSAFANCPALTSVSIPSTVTKIGVSAFASCPVLDNVVIPNSVTQIQDSAFANCSGLTTLTLGNGITSIGIGSFTSCTSLATLSIPDSVTSIWNGAFSGCTGLTTLTIGKGVTNIGDSAFSGCTNLTTVVIGRGVTSIGTLAFAKCDALASFLFLGNAPSPDANVFDKINLTIYYLAGKTGWKSTFAGLPTAVWPGPITSLSPNHGSANGGTTVTIVGTNFTSATGVYFGGTPADSYAIVSATQILAVAPAGSIGQQLNVTVATPQGTTPIVPADLYTYDIPTPIVTGLSPTHGTEAGGTSVVISGSNFNGATAVKFGLVAATSFVVNSGTQITAVAPVESAGLKVDVTVTTGGGTSATSAADKFTFDYQVPTLTGVSPSHGAAGGGTSVIITGTHFLGTTAVTFGSTAAVVFNVNSDSQITAVAPSGTPGSTVDLTVTTPGGTTAISAADQYNYDILVPAITKLTPTHGSAAGGTPVIIAGSNLDGATAVKFGAVSATSFTVNSSSQITAVSPAGTIGSKVDISVTSPLGTSLVTAADQFTYDTPVPVVTGLSPTHGSPSGNTVVVIHGQSFTGATTVKFGSIPASFTVNSDTQITGTSPAGSPGQQIDVRVTTPGGTSAASGADLFQYNFPDSTPPKVILHYPTGKNVASSFDVTGIAVDNQGIDRVEVTLNGGPVQQATVYPLISGSASFILQGVIPENGKNTLVIRAFDYVQNASTPVTVTVTYVNSRPQFAGSYNGLIVSGSSVTPSIRNSGLLNLSVTSAGAFTGKAMLGGYSIPVAGIIGNDGTARFNPTLGTTKALVGSTTSGTLGQLAFALDVTGSSGKITGTLEDGNSNLISSLDADHAFFDGVNNLVDPQYLLNGGYDTVIFASKAQVGNPATSTYPQGDGFGSLKVSTKGIATLKGTLPDGTGFTASAPLSKNYEVPCFAQLYSKQGAIAGKVSLSSTNGVTQVKGIDTLWFRPANATSKYYPAGWPNGVTIDLLGTQYSVPALGNSVFPGLNLVDPVNGNATLEFSAGKLTIDPLDKNLNINPNNTVSNIADTSFVLKITSSTGFIAGTFTHSDGTKPAYKGAILQHDVDAGAYLLKAGAYGFFLSTPPSILGGTGESGSVTLFAK